MQKASVIAALLPSVLVSVLPCFAGTTEGTPDMAFSVPDYASTRVSPTESLMRSVSDSPMSYDAQHISVKNVNGSTVISGYAKDDRERQMISHFAEQANCPYIVNEVKVRPPLVEEKKATVTAEDQTTHPEAQPHKAKTILIRNGKQYVF